MHFIRRLSSIEGYFCKSRCPSCFLLKLINFWSHVFGRAKTSINIVKLDNKCTLLDF